MAAAKRSKAAKKSAPRTTQKERNTAKRQLTAVVLFGLGILLAAIVFIPGENFWNIMRGFLFGMFGILTYLVPFFVILVAVLCTLDKLNKNIKIKSILSGIVAVFTIAVIDVFTTKIPLPTFPNI